MNTLRLIYVYFRVSVLNETAYRVNFFIQLFQSLLELGTALAGLAVIFSYTNTLGGWRPDEMLALVGVYFLVGGLMSMPKSAAGPPLPMKNKYRFDQMMKAAPGARIRSARAVLKYQ